MSKKISLGTYNGLYAHAEVGVNILLDNLGILNDFKVYEHLGIEPDPEGREKVYQIYRETALHIVNNILKDLDIEVDG